MARPHRIIYENAYYHVMNRGAGRQKIFNDRIDREIFLQTLSESVEQFRIEIHAYCLMGNHYHLLIKTPQANLSRAMRHINGVYTQRYNRTHKTDGALFKGRYKAILVDSNAYLLHLSKYIHLNPLSAQIVEVGALEQYEWSSYPAYINKIKPPLWLVKEEVYGQLTSNTPYAEQYQNFINNEILDETLLKFYQQQSALPILGSKEFLNSLTIVKPSMEVPQKAQVIKRPPISAIILEVSLMYGEDIDVLITTKKGRGRSNIPRKMAMYVARKYADYRLKEIADMFGLRHYGAVSSTLHLFIKELQNDSLLKETVYSIVNNLGMINHSSEGA